MRILSATEAVSPAIARTKLVLFKPFRLGRSWKFCAAAYVSAMGSFFFPFPLFALFMVPAVYREGPKWLVWTIVPAIALLLALVTFIFVLCSRIQFPVMDVVMNRSVFIAPLWRQYGPQAHRWVRAKILIGTITSLVTAIPFVILVWAFMRGGGSHLGPTTPQQVPQLVAGFYLCFFLVYGGLGLVVLVMSLLNDFMLPPLALEDAPVARAWQFVQNLVRAEPGQVALYALLKVVLGFIAQMACAVIMEIILFLLVIVLGIIGYLLGILLHAVGLPNIILEVLAIIGFSLLYLGFIGYAAPFANGVSTIFLEAYKLYFLGGRYPPLGDLLDRSTPPLESLPPAPIYGYVPLPPSPPAPDTL
jgi:hypothetical protein